jgi:pimeloyl-ACP methyl ester carboxylesterase
MERFMGMPEGFKLFVEESGKGEALLFVHADFLDGRMWKDALARAAPAWRAASYDKRGYGRSDPATGPVCRRRELEAVMEGLGMGSAHLVGCSNGGLGALDLALEKPELVRSLTLVNSPPSGFAPEGEPPAELLEMIAAAQRGDSATASELQLRIWFDGQGRKPEGLDPERRAARAEAGIMNRIVVERSTFWIADAAPAAPLEPPALGRLGELRIPTLVVSGALDHPENRRASKILAEGIPGARFVELADCAHVPPLEAPGRFAEILFPFLEGCRRGA